MDDWWKYLRGNAGNAIDLIGTAGGGKDRGWSEWIAGENTANTGGRATTSYQPQQEPVRQGSYNSFQNVTPQVSNSFNRGQVLGDKSIVSGGTGYYPPTPTPTTGAEDNERKYYDNLMNSIRGRLDMARGQAGQLRDQARGVRDEVVGNIGSTYSNLEKSIRDKVASALAGLGQEDVRVQNLYGKASGTARRASAGAETKNRMQARAMNRLNSSFYDDMQSGVREGLVRSLSDIGTEEADKRTGIKTRMTDTTNFGDQQISASDAEEARLLSQAERGWQTANNAANDLEKGYSLNSLDEMGRAEYDLNNRLSAINNFMSNKGNILAQAGQSAGNIGNAVSSYQAINPTLASALANNTGLNSANETIASLPTFNYNGAGGNNYLALRNPNANASEEELRRLGLLLA